MGQTEATRQADWILPIMADTTGNVAGAALTASTSAVIIDLSTMIAATQAYLSGSSHAMNPDPLGKYLNLQAQGNDVFCVFGPTLASVSGANAPNPATVNTVTAHAVNNIPGICMWIPQNATAAIKTPVGSPDTTSHLNSPCRFLAFVTSTGSATLRIWASSPL
jgi:hypothetical protein